MVRKISKEFVISEIKRIAKDLNKDTLLQKEFKPNAKCSIDTVKNYFPTWNDALEAAGLQKRDKSKATTEQLTIPDKDLLIDLLRIYKKTGKVPGKTLITREGKYSISPYIKRWKDYETAFNVACEKHKSDIEGLEVESITENDSDLQIKYVPDTHKPQNPIKRDRQRYGELINFRGLSHAPINEQGVVFLFGMISHELGYRIESVRIKYPDCSGKRKLKDTNEWEDILIEFEYKSKNFFEHGHNPEECHIIVCWEHDWEECPLEVLELKNIIKYLDKE